MPLEEIGAILLFLVVVFLLGNLWFHFIETILKWLKKRFTRQQKNSRMASVPTKQGGLNHV